ncbi:MAG: MurR/RpiR family transcriptional regulator [Gammaproteobacteria bacterium]|nr:MurR/RpiR family transcriptional regulator [Gammaproteobacteria bacterium]
MSCLAIIRSARDEMSANEKKLADFILENPSLIRDYSSQQIAGSVGISQSSVVKFSQKMGYKGFTDLKLAIHETVVKQESNVAVLNGRRASSGSGVSLKNRLFQAKSDAISGATDLNDDDTLRVAARAIESSSHVQLVSSGSAYSVVRDSALKLMSIGKPVIAEADAEVQLLGVATLTRGDCLIVISASGQSAHLCHLAQLAKKAGATIISVTNQSANPLAALADVRLYSVSYGSDSEMPNVVAATSQQHVIDLVFYTLALADERGKKLLAGDRGQTDLSKVK